MTFTNELKTKFAGLSLVLRSVNTNQATALIDWLPIDTDFNLVPLGQNVNINKLTIALPNSEHFEQIVHKICLQIGDNNLVEWRGKTYEVTGLEVDKSDLHILQIPIYTAEKFSDNIGSAIHALIFHWFDLCDSELALRLHSQENIPFAISVKPCKTHRQIYLQIAILQKQLLAPFLYGLSKELGKEILLSDIPCRLGRVVEISQTQNFANLLQIPSEELIEIDLITPTSFKQNQVIQPFPLPELVFNNLWRRWNAFAPIELQLPPIEWQAMVVAYQLKTKAIKLKSATEIGSTGWVKYKFSNPEQTKIATTLAFFAEFAGIGRKTAMGMGRSRFLPKT